jgi:hypothetical protein
MSSPSSFSGHTVTAGFKLVENMLAESLDYIPFCTEHEFVWSPRFITILLEAGGQLDSLWRFEATHGPVPVTPTGKDLNMVDYHRVFNSRMAGEWLVFWGEDGRKLQPFSPWASAIYSPLDWWQAYNKVKHDRLTNRKEATLKITVDAVASLFLAILKSPLCGEAVALERWIDPDMFDKLFGITSPPSLGPNFVSLDVAESRLMCYLYREVGGQPGAKVKVDCDNFRFYSWYKNNCNNPDYEFV